MSMPSMMIKLVAIAICAIALLDQVAGQTCGGSFYGSGSFSSPNYPGLYPNIKTCVWNMTAIIGNYVRLTFSEINLQAFSDELIVLSGGIVVASYGGSLTRTTAVFGSWVTVIFASDSAGQDRGFTVQFDSVPEPACGIACSLGQCTVWTPGFPGSNPYQTTCSWNINAAVGRYLALDVIKYRAAYLNNYMMIRNYTNGVLQNTITHFSSVPPVSQILSNGAILTLINRYPDQSYAVLAQFSSKGAKCGGVLSGAGSLTTPGYPNDYPNDLVCIWRLDATPGKRVQLQILDFSTENNYDTVRVFNNNSFVTKLSGLLTPGTYALGWTVTLEFLSDFTVTARGLSMRFISV